MSVIGTLVVEQISVDGLIDSGTGIKYIGLATKQSDGTWRCLADVDGCLCVVKIKVTFLEVQKS